MFAEGIRWMLGSREYRIPSEMADRAAALLARSGADVRGMKRRGDELCFSLGLGDAQAVERILARNGIEPSFIRERGLPQRLGRYRRRYGIPVGLGMFFAILWASGQFIWTMDVKGNDKIPADAILTRLEALGCHVGTYIPSIDFDDLHHEFLLQYDDISWIAVNLRGTGATVEVREMEIPEIRIDESTPFNLVAAEDGILVEREIYRGTPEADVGDLVRKGDLLASGVVDTPGGYRLLHARGKVLAQVKRTVTVEIPLEERVKRETGAVFYEKSVKFFGFSLKFFKNTGNLPAEYDIIKRETPLRIFDTIEVPVALCVEEFRVYEWTSHRLTGEEARARAYARLRDELEQLSAQSEQVSREIRGELTEDAYRLTCRLELICDIAKEAPIYQ